MVGPIVFHQNVLEVYVGLIASGYDLTNPKRCPQLLHRLRVVTWSKQLVEYFRYARIGDGRINPYWPRAYFLTLLSYHTNMDVHKTQEAVQSLANIGPQEKSDEVFHWLASFPAIIAELQMSACYTGFLEEYCAVVEDEICQRGRQHTKAMEHVMSALGLDEDEKVQYITVLNPLQADHLTDCVDLGEKTCVLVSHLRKDSILHEMLHRTFQPLFHSCRDMISQHRHLLGAVYAAMARMSYAWNQGDGSWHNVFSETFVRAASVWAQHRDDLRALERQIQKSKEEGFLYIGSMVRTFQNHWHKMGSQRDFINALLDACKNV